MGDVANILGISKKTGGSRSSSTSPLPPSFKAPPTRAAPTNKGPKLRGIQKEVMNLLNSTSSIHGKVSDSSEGMLPPIVPSSANYKTVRNLTSSEIGSSAVRRPPAPGIKKGIASMKGRPARKWVWASFDSSARSDKAKFSHWVKADVEYPDYPYARFDVHLDPVVYNDDEYDRYLKDEPNWTKSDTDKLMEICRTYELRWPVVYDRYNSVPNTDQDDSSSSFPRPPVRKTEDLQHRYYYVATKLTKVRMELVAASQVQSNGAGGTINPLALDMINKVTPSITLGTGSSTVEFNLNNERERRKQLESRWNRPKDDENEEIELKAELKRLEAQIRKLKKNGRHLIEASNGKNSASGVNELDKYFARKHASICVPYLQSARLMTPKNTDAVVNKTLLKKMELVVKELNIPERLVPTKRCCDLYDSLRKNVITLLTLQKIALKKEYDVAAKRTRLNKLYPGSVDLVKDSAGILDKAIAAVTRPSSSSASTSSKKSSSSSSSKTKKPTAKNSKSLENMSSGKKATKRKSLKKSSNTTDNKSNQNLTASTNANPQISAATGDDSNKPNKKRVRKS